MDNVKYYNDSLAYDFEMFMPHTAVKEKPDNIVRLPQTSTKQRAKRRAANKAVSVSAFAVLASVLMLAALCGNIFLRLQINEVDSKINSIKSEINTLESEKTSLEVKYERIVSYSNIEEEAKNLGMRKMEKSQVKYIHVNDKDTATTKNGKTVSSQN